MISNFRIRRARCLGRGQGWIASVLLAMSGCVALADNPAALNSIINQGRENAPVEAPPEGAQPELWIRAAAPLSNVQLIVAQPESNSSCREVIFKRREGIPVRHVAEAGKRLRIALQEACWIGLRNGSDNRSLVLRMGEAMQKLAIAPNPQLSVGRELRPHEQVRIALKPLAIERLEVTLEAIWIEDLSEGRSVQAMTFEFIGQR